MFQSLYGKLIPFKNSSRCSSSIKSKSLKSDQDIRTAEWRALACRAFRWQRWFPDWWSGPFQQPGIRRRKGTFGVPPIKKQFYKNKIFVTLEYVVHYVYITAWSIPNRYTTQRYGRYWEMLMVRLQSSKSK